MTTFRTFKPVKLVAAVATIVAVMLAAATPSQAQTGAVRLNIVKVGFIVGAGGGSGALSYHTAEHIGSASVVLAWAASASRAPISWAPPPICTAHRI
jgi:hypothetical protein